MTASSSVDPIITVFSAIGKESEVTVQSITSALNVFDFPKVTGEAALPYLQLNFHNYSSNTDSVFMDISLFPLFVEKVILLFEKAISLVSV